MTSEITIPKEEEIYKPVWMSVIKRRGFFYIHKDSLHDVKVDVFSHTNLLLQDYLNVNNMRMVEAKDDLIKIFKRK